MLPVISLLVVVVVSMVVVRVATVALIHTGLSAELARFQARSAFTGTGFTTSESEKLLQHPVRRRIVMTLMLLGSAGFVTVFASLMLSVTNLANDNPATASFWLRVGLLSAGLSGLWLLGRSEWVDRQMTRAISSALKHWTDLDVRDYAGLLHLTGGYVVSEILVQPNDWMAGRELHELRLSSEGVLVLGIERAEGFYIGAPRGQTKLNPGDTVILYGRSETLVNLDERRAGWQGNWEHHKAVDAQLRVLAEERGRESEAGHEKPQASDATASVAEPPAAADHAAEP